MAENIWTKLKAFTTKSKRVWHALKKPTKQEFQMVSKVSAIGIAVLGILGFLISLIIKVFV